MNREKVAEELVKIARSLVAETKIRSAISSPHVKGITVGIDDKKKTLIFLTKDYAKGVVSGPVEDISKTKGAFYILGYNYDKSAMEKLDYSEKDKKKLVDTAKKFLSKKAKDLTSAIEKITIAYPSGGGGVKLHNLDQDFIGSNDYMGLGTFWSGEYKHSLRGLSPLKKRAVHDAFLKARLELSGESPAHDAILNKLGIRL